MQLLRLSFKWVEGFLNCFSLQAISLQKTSPQYLQDATVTIFFSAEKKGNGEEGSNFSAIECCKDKGLRSLSSHARLPSSVSRLRTAFHKIKKTKEENHKLHM